MGAPSDRHPFVMPNVMDGMDRPHDLLLEVREGKVILRAPTKFWSMVLTPTQGHTLAAAIDGASDRAENKPS